MNCDLSLVEERVGGGEARENVSVKGAFCELNCIYDTCIAYIDHKYAYKLFYGFGAVWG